MGIQRAVGPNQSSAKWHSKLSARAHPQNLFSITNRLFARVESRQIERTRKEHEEFQYKNHPTGNFSFGFVNGLRRMDW